MPNRRSEAFETASSLKSFMALLYCDVPELRMDRSRIGMNKSGISAPLAELAGRDALECFEVSGKMELVLIPQPAGDLLNIKRGGL